METKYLEIETICIEIDSVTIAAEVVLNGLNYSEPAYTNIFCDKTQLIDLMLEESSEISMQLLNSISSEDQSLNGILQIDLGDYSKSKSWRPGLKLMLNPVESTAFGFTCYDLVSCHRNESKT